MSHLTVTIPRSSAHPYSILLVTTPNETIRMSFDESHKTAEIELPEGVTEDQISIVAEFWDARHQRDEGMESVIVKEVKSKDDGNKGKDGKEGEGKGGRKRNDEKPIEEVKTPAATKPVEGQPSPEHKPAEGEKPADKS